MLATVAVVEELSQTGRDAGRTGHVAGEHLPPRLQEVRCPDLRAVHQAWAAHRRGLDDGHAERLVQRGVHVQHALGHQRRELPGGQEVVRLREGTRLLQRAPHGGRKLGAGRGAHHAGHQPTAPQPLRAQQPYGLGEDGHVLLGDDTHAAQQVPPRDVRRHGRRQLLHLVAQGGEQHVRVGAEGGPQLLPVALAQADAARGA
mmetsp:Transcript_20399/g.53564  ORF Transcript_20399/g.53564 Transcript_20399/m.53564 type:complete len:202 (+) Transcript_20399:131-736(+)